MFVFLRSQKSKPARTRNGISQRQWSRLNLESLEERCLLSWGVTPPDPITPCPTSGVQVVSLDTSGDAGGSASISRNLEIDWYRFTTRTSGNYTFRADTPSSNLDTVIGIYSSSCRRVAYNDDIDRPNGNLDSRVTTPLVGGQIYYLGVTNYHRQRTGGAYNWSIDGPPEPINSPAASSDLQASIASPRQIDLRWTDNSNNETGFKIEYKSGNRWTPMNSVGANVTTYPDKGGLSPGATYCYRVLAYNAAGNSNPSNEACVTYVGDTPVAPSDLQASIASPRQIDLRWTDNSNNETGFKIEYKSGNRWTPMNSVGANVTTYPDKGGLSPGATYCYRVLAFNDAGNSNDSNEACVRYVGDPGIPVPIPDPSNLEARVVSPRQIDLNWRDNSNNETRFEIEYRGGTTGSWRPMGVTPANVTTYPDKGSLSLGSTYCYRVRASNGVSNSNYSNEACVRYASPEVPRPEDPGFQIDLSFSGLSATQQAIVNQAADRWEQVITGDLPNAQYGGRTVDDLLIDVRAVRIDRPGNTLARAWPDPDALRSGSFLPHHGFMQFDTWDLTPMEARGNLYDVALHELGHVLGLGTIWSNLGLLTGAGGSNPRFIGSQATAAYNAIFGVSGSSVPVEGNESGPGSRDSHWSESVFRNELMTPNISGSTRPLSRVTAASMLDLGYTVNLNAADPYSLPSSSVASSMHFGPLRQVRGQQDGESSWVARPGTGLDLDAMAIGIDRANAAESDRDPREVISHRETSSRIATSRLVVRPSSSQQSFTYDLSAYKGQSVTLKISSWTVDWRVGVDYFLDDLSIIA